MKPSKRAQIAAAITLSKGKMYEYGIPLAQHIDLPAGLDLEEQFPLAIGTLGDFASETSMRTLAIPVLHETPREDIVFAAQVLQAFDDSKLSATLSFELKLMAAASFYLGDLPGSAAVLIKQLILLDLPTDDTLAIAARVALDRPWVRFDINIKDRRATRILEALHQHFLTGGGQDAALKAIRELRDWAYSVGSAHELLIADILGSVTATRILNSAWTLLPLYTGLPVEIWQPYLARPTGIKEMWSSQRMLGDSGLYRGESGVIQMPTSAGKTRATELILRAAFLSGRTNLAVVVAPFRALCQEITDDLQATFTLDGYDVNQLSDALQPDYKSELFEFFGMVPTPRPHVVVLTPEKLLYLLRQEPMLVKRLGLILYDEGHQFDNGIRGVTYELLLTSIKRLLPPNAQTVLISAVIQNAADVAGWLLAKNEKVVSHSQLQARRLVAFVSLPEGMDGRLHFSAAVDWGQEFFVPRVIIKEKLKRNRLERIDRYFPTNESGSVALYLGLRLVSNGGIAIYARTRASATKILRDAVEEVFARDVSLPAPLASSNSDELKRFKHLFTENFGADSYLTQGAELGLFTHHGNTPHGLRLAIEYGMREGMIRFIVCTSTLVQGVNLPIRYLLITTPTQGRDAIKARDFHNLMGRAGRAGMYGEGTVIFTDHRLYDERFHNRDRWMAALHLLRPESAGPTGSTLLALLEPMRSENGRNVVDNPTPYQIATQLIDDRKDLYERIANLPQQTQQQGFSSEFLKQQLDIKRATIEAIESFLMTYRGEANSDAFINTSRALARETLAFFLANPEQQQLLEEVFERVARRIEKLVPQVNTQARYGRTLLGVDKALAIDKWVGDNLEELQQTNSADEIFQLLWPLMTHLSSEKQLKVTELQDALLHMAKGWLGGKPYHRLLSDLKSETADVPQKKGKRQFDIDRVVGLCEHTFGYEFSLIIAAVKVAFIQAVFIEEDASKFGNNADLLQKRLKYGLPSQDTISYFEAGFAERVVAQKVASEVFFDVAKSPAEARDLVRKNASRINAVITLFPSYFSSVFLRITT